MENVRLTVEGLQFNETQDKVKSQLEGIVGVRSVLLSEGQNYVEVNYDDQTSAQEINNHLQNNGYKISEFIQ